MRYTKELTMMAMLILFSVMAVSPVWADSITKNANASATVGGNFDLNISMQQFQRPPGGTETSTGSATLLASMNFGKLCYDDDCSNKTFKVPGRGEFYYKVWIGVTSNHGRVYTVKHNAGPMSLVGDPSATIPNGAFICVPMHLPADNPTLDSGGTEGNAGTAVATDKVLYTSGTGGIGQVVQVVYALSADPNSGFNNATIPGWQAIPSTQKAGTYSTGITITLSD